MILHIELTPDQETQLNAFARHEGLDPAELVKRLVTERLPVLAEPNGHGKSGTTLEANRNHFYFTASREEFNRALDEIAEMNRTLPVLPPEAFERESLYEDY